MQMAKPTHFNYHKTDFKITFWFGFNFLDLYQANLVVSFSEYLEYEYLLKGRND